jgi:hypothetical protein
MFLVCLEAKLSPYAALRRALPKENKLILAKGKRCALGHFALAAEESPTLPSVHPTFPRSSTHRRRLCAPAAVCRHGGAAAVIRLRRAFNPTFLVRSCMKTFLDLFWRDYLFSCTSVLNQVKYCIFFSQNPNTSVQSIEKTCKNCMNLNQIYWPVALLCQDIFKPEVAGSGFYSLVMLQPYPSMSVGSKMML